MSEAPWEGYKTDERLLTDLPLGPYLEAAKAWGRFASGPNSTDTETIKTWCWESCLAALRVYEYERSRPSH